MEPTIDEVYACAVKKFKRAGRWPPSNVPDTILLVGSHASTISRLEYLAIQSVNVMIFTCSGEKWPEMPPSEFVREVLPDARRLFGNIVKDVIAGKELPSRVGGA